MLNFKYHLFVALCCAAVNGTTFLYNTINASVLFYYGAVSDLFVSEYDKTNIFLSKTTNVYTSYDLTVAENIVDHPNFDHTKSTVIFIHGWLQSPNKITVQTLIKAYIVNGNYNILILDWSQAAGSGVIRSVMSKVPGLGVDVALFLNRLNKKGVAYSNVHMIGHSLGANVASSAGKYIISNYGSRLARITGLDPANLYKPLLKASDAAFVDIIHTNPGVMGSYSNSGTVDFWSNRFSLVQPGCPLIPLNMEDFACSHRRALDLFSESVRNNFDDNFLSTNINNPFDQVQMGNNCPTTATGVYMLRTNDKSLYAVPTCKVLMGELQESRTQYDVVKNHRKFCKFRQTITSFT